MADKLRGGSTAGGALIYTTDNLDRNNIDGELDVTGTITAPTFIGALTGNSSTATKWATARTLTTTLTGDVTGTASMSVDGTGNKTTTITTVVGNNSHTHTSANITDATSANTANKIVERDGSGNFSAGTITASLTGTASNADKLDNLNSTQFLRSDQNDTTTGSLGIGGDITTNSGNVNLTAAASVQYNSSTDSIDFVFA